MDARRTGKGVQMKLKFTKAQYDEMTQQYGAFTKEEKEGLGYGCVEEKDIPNRKPVTLEELKKSQETKK